MDIDRLIDEMLDELCIVIKENATVRRKMARVIKRHLAEGGELAKKPLRRKPGPFDPMAVHRELPDQLEGRLAALEVEELKDIIAEYGMDRSKLAMKWKTKARLIELILSTVRSRSQKGDAFRSPG